MCSSGGDIAVQDKALQDANTTMAKTLNADYSTAFAQQQSVLGQQQARLNAIAANPMGYSTAALHSAKAAINDNTATAAKQAIGSAAAYAASHGGADVGSGVTGQIAGQIASGAAQSKAQQLGALSAANEQMKQSNFWNATSGLSNVGSEYGGAGSTAVNGASSESNSAVSAGTGELAAQNAGWEHLGGVLSGIGGLVGSVASIPGVKV